MSPWVRRSCAVLVLVVLGGHSGGVSGRQRSGRVATLGSRVVYVDARHPDASDTGPGTGAQPLATVAESARRALSNRRLGVGTRVIIQPGIYREHVEFAAASTPVDAPPIVLEGAARGAVVLSGSDVWTGWTQEASTSLYRHPMPESRGAAPLPEGWDSVREQVEGHPVILRGEAVFVGGSLYRQVMARAELEAEPRRFFVDKRGGPGGAVLTVHLEAGSEPRDTTIEVLSVRRS